jgi:hypothetical protein
VIIHSTCGPQYCYAYIRVYNPAISTGSLAIDPYKELPLCHGEDATVVFTPQPNCVWQWKWYTNIVPNPVDISDYVEMTELGQNNPLLNTNILTETKWYMVTSNNGPCPNAHAYLEVPVKEEISIVGYSIINDPCLEEWDLVLEFSPTPHPGPASCNYEVEGIFNGIPVGSYNYTTSPATLSFTVNSNELFGNFQAIIRDSCCDTEYETNVVTIEPVCEPVVSGPCYRCFGDTDPITLEATMMLPTGLPCNTPCSYQWLDENFDPIPAANSLTYITNVGGLFYFQSDCNGCIKTTSIYVADCDQPCNTNIGGLEGSNCYNITIFPNPNKGEFTIKVDPEPLKGSSMKVFDQHGKQVFAKELDDGNNFHDVKLDFLPPGFYYIQVFAKNLPPFSRKVLIVK